VPRARSAESDIRASASTKSEAFCHP